MWPGGELPGSFVVVVVIMGSVSTSSVEPYTWG